MSEEGDRWVSDTVYGGVFRVDKRVFAFSQYIHEQNKSAIELSDGMAKTEQENHDQEKDEA